MNIELDANSAVPPFEQLKTIIIDRIRSGELPVNAKLPAIRVLAGQLGLAANTVARSYKELEQEGYVQTMGRSGTRVNSHAVATDLALEQEAQGFVRRVSELGATATEIQSAVQHALDNL